MRIGLDDAAYSKHLKIKDETMSKKRKNSKPNIPEAALERARQQIAGGEGETVSETASKVVKEVAPKRKVKRRKASVSADAAKRRSGELSGERIAEILARPTKEVTEAELREDYGYVLRDLRSMGVLAGVLFVILILLGVAQSFLV